MEANFRGPSFTLGVEEELMIVEPETLGLANAIEELLEEADEGHVQPELMESVLEIATQPCANTAEAAVELRSLRRQVRDAAQRRGLLIGSAGTHPFALWEDQRISARPRYRDLVSALRFVARQEVIFGMHVHVGMDDADKAIHVANGFRAHVPILLALSANSPFWRGDTTGLASARMPIFRAFPRVGIPPAWEDWADFEARIGAMVDARVIEDYTYLWYDVRPHPRLGTVEVRAMDAQTRVEHTLAIAALVQGLARALAADFDAGVRPEHAPHELLDENKWLAARHGLAGDLVDLPAYERVATRDLARRAYERALPHAQDLGSADELEGILDLVERGTGAQRQQVVYEANSDFRELMTEIVAATHE